MSFGFEYLTHVRLFCVFGTKQTILKNKERTYHHEQPGKKGESRLRGSHHPAGPCASLLHHPALAHSAAGHPRRFHRCPAAAVCFGKAKPPAGNRPAAPCRRARAGSGKHRLRQCLCPRHCAGAKQVSQRQLDLGILRRQMAHPERRDRRHPAEPGRRLSAR